MDNVPLILLELIEQFRKGNVVLFVGAGLSMGAGLPGWRQLIHPLAEQIGCDSDLDLLTIAQYYDNQRGRQALISHIREQTGTVGVAPTENHRLLVQLPVQTIITTNYDDLLELTLRESGKHFNRVVLGTDMAFWSEDQVQLIKMHGTLDVPDSIIITRQDYSTYFKKYTFLSRALTDLLITKTFLFVGYSLCDHDFNQIYDEIGYDLARYRRMAYAILFDADRFVVDDLRQRHLQVINILMEGQSNYSERLGAILRELVERTQVG